MTLPDLSWCCNSPYVCKLIPNSKHYAERRCGVCGKFYGYYPKPKNGDKNRKDTSAYKIKDIIAYHKYDFEFCFYCGRIKEQLGIKETLEIDHILELKDGGKDELVNLQILCSACHPLKNWVQCYLKRHQKREMYDKHETGNV